jgi:hypothetical protein
MTGVTTSASSHKTSDLFVLAGTPVPVRILGGGNNDWGGDGWSPLRILEMMLAKKFLRQRWLFSHVCQAFSRSIPGAAKSTPVHVLLSIANHFEPGWGGALVSEGMARVRAWIHGVEGFGKFRDPYGSPFKHTYFFPVEQYAEEYLDVLLDHCRRGFGEPEVHLHHGLNAPDNAANLRRTLLEYLGVIKSRHGWLVRDTKGRGPCYAFVHGDWALGNSAGGLYCGVDEELAILRETGCYVDMTMPSAPDPTQIGMINAIYVPGGPLDRPAPHRSGTPLRVGAALSNPPFFLIQGPLLLNWRARKYGIIFPRIENGDLSADYPPTLDRFRLWTSANVHVQGRPEWVFVKLHCHGLQERHLRCLTGEPIRRFLEELLAWASACGIRLHFVTAREMANIALAAVEGAKGDPDEFRDYNWKL